MPESVSGIQLQGAAPSQLPVASYFDEALYQRELASIFNAMPQYVGHELAIPHVGHYHTLQQEAGGRALLRTARGVELISNVCRHRQAIMLKGRGAQQGQIVCPLHRWTYDVSGQQCHRHAHRRAPFRARPLPAFEQLPAAKLEWSAV